MKFKYLLFVGLLLATIGWAQTISGGGLAISCLSVTTTGACSSFSLAAPNGQLPAAFTWQSITTGSPGGVSLTLEGSIDGTTWSTLDTSTATGGEVRSVTGKPMRQLRCNLVTFTGGAAPTMTCQFTVTTAGTGGGGGGGGSGTVNGGTTGQYAFYAANGTAVSGGGPITTNALAKGDAANALATSLASDNGTALTYTGTGGVVASGTTGLSAGANGGAVGVINLLGNTSGTATITAPAVAGTTTNAVVFSNNIRAPNQANCTNGGSFNVGGSAGISFPGGANVLSVCQSNSEFIRFNNPQLQIGAGIYSMGNAVNAASEGMSRSANGVIAFGNGTATNKTALLQSGMTVFVASNFTTAANTNLQTITGLSWTFPATALNWSFDCDIAYSQATASAAVAFGIQAATNNPTNIFATGIQQITVGPPATSVAGTLATLATTTATNIVSGTPGATGTNYTVHLGGTIELGASANTINIMVSTATSGDAVTVLRGSRCSLTP